MIVKNVCIYNNEYMILQYKIKQGHYEVLFGHPRSSSGEALTFKCIFSNFYTIIILYTYVMASEQCDDVQLLGNGRLVTGLFGVNQFILLQQLVLRLDCAIIVPGLTNSYNIIDTVACYSCSLM